MATRNIQMNYYNGTNYDVLYPQSTIAQISNLQSSLNSKLNLSGGTMTGNLMLNGDPSSNLQAVTKQYVDNSVSGIEEDVFFEKILEKNFVVNFTTGNTSLILDGSINTGLETELTENLFMSSIIIVIKVNVTINSGSRGSIIFSSTTETTTEGLKLIRFDSSLVDAVYNFNIIYTLSGMEYVSLVSKATVSGSTSSWSYITPSDFYYLLGSRENNSYSNTITGKIGIVFYSAK